MDVPWLTPHPGGVILRLRIAPGARRTAPDAPRAGRIPLRVQAPPVDGKANAAVLRWAARALGVRVSAITLLRGERGREKDLLIEGLDSAGARAALEPLLPATPPADERP